MIAPRPVGAFDVKKYLSSAGTTRRIRRFPPGKLIFSQGNPANAIYYIQEGQVKLTVVSPRGKEAVVAVAGPGDFFGEGCLAAQTQRMSTALAITSANVMIISKAEMIRTLHEQPAFSDRFLAHMLTRNVRIEEDLIDHLFNSSEKRLARILLLLARYGSEDGSTRPLPKLSQETLAEMVGTTRSRVNFFLNKFRKLGFIEYNGHITVKHSLLTVVLHD